MSDDGSGDGIGRTTRGLLRRSNPGVGVGDGVCRPHVDSDADFGEIGMMGRAFAGPSSILGPCAAGDGLGTGSPGGMCCV